MKEFNSRLDIFVANAGIPWSQGSFLDGEVEHYKNVMSTDMDSVYYCAYAAGLHWRRQKMEGTDLNGKKLENFKLGSFIATASMRYVGSEDSEIRFRILRVIAVISSTSLSYRRRIMAPKLQSSNLVRLPLQRVAR